MIARDGHDCPSWGQGNSAKGEVKEKEHPLEQCVSDVIRPMPFVWVAIDDAPGKDSLRGHIERNAIALLRNYDKPPLNAPSKGWLGHYCNREKVRKSGLWNSRHIDEEYDPKFLDRFEELVRQQ